MKSELLANHSELLLRCPRISWVCLFSHSRAMQFHPEFQAELVELT